ncbi:TolC family protein [Nitrosophilus alvini]|uniref:TolC family protein n=1 Tax=Nitrosophilus alvini TaxID=2714855 RepID=UPI00190BD0F5|nr:TolC family protein [Nitrosophilus alvini]
MRIIMILSFLFSLAFAKVAGLKEIMEKFEKTHPAAVAIQKEIKLLQTKTKLSIVRDPAEFRASSAYAEENSGISGKEYYFELNQQFLVPNVKKSLKNSALSGVEARILNLKFDFLKLKYSIKNLYKQTCLNRKIYKLRTENLFELEGFYKKMQKAYKLGEVSKKDILALEMEKRKAFVEVQSAKNDMTESFLNLKKLLSSTEIEFDEILCEEGSIKIEDINYEPEKIVENSPDILSYKAYIKKLQARLRGYESTIERFDVSMEYSDELGTKRYLVGVGIPLNFSSSKRQLEKKAIMESISLKRTELENLVASKKAAAMQLLTRLKNVVNNYKTTKKLEDGARELTSLTLKSYLAGESSLLELLISKRELINLQIETLNFKKRYFETLFELYKTIGFREDI